MADQCECITDSQGECLICDDPYNEDGPCDCHLSILAAPL